MFFLISRWPLLHLSLCAHFNFADASPVVPLRIWVETSLCNEQQFMPDGECLLTTPTASFCWCCIISQPMGRPGHLLPWFLPPLWVMLTATWQGATAALTTGGHEESLTSLQTEGLPMQRQSTFNSFIDTPMDQQAKHIWPLCAD